MSSSSNKSDSGGGGGGGCPMKHRGGGGTSEGVGGKCPVKHNSSSQPQQGLPFGIPASIEESAQHSQTPLKDQKIPLSTNRVVSSIPRGNDNQVEAPAHQPSNSEQWVYPSEQQFYSAMRRKGWQGVDERTIPAVVRIHNFVNERGWTEVQQWESTLHGCDNPKLVRFMGRPNDLSPRAWVHTYLLGNRPFDRHDWFVDRGDGQEPRRYVIDFYSHDNDSSNNSNGPPRMYLDVRPALDSPEAAADRIKMFVRDAFPALYSLFQNSSSSGSGSGDNDKPPAS